MNLERHTQAMPPKKGARKPAKRSVKEGTPDVEPPQKKRKSNGQVKQPRETRPFPQGVPPVWALLRGDLTETVDYFRQRQGGVQTNDGSFRGSLLANDYGQRPYLDGELVLTRAGGGMEQSKDGTKTMRQKKNQEPFGSVVQSFLGNVANFVACPMILSSDCRHAPSRPLFPYAVMAHFKPVFHWYEKDDGFRVSRFRWEKFDLGEEAWWMPQGSPVRSGPVDYATKAARQTCSLCLKSQPVIFTQGFVCLDQSCGKFWSLNGKALVNDDRLTYNPTWLAERTEWPQGIRPPFALRPQPLPLSGAEKDPTFATMRAAYKGIVCPLCRSCIARQRLEGWFCATEGCQFEYLLPPININIKSISDAYAGQFDGHGVPNYEVKAPVSLKETVFLQPWRILTYDIMGFPDCLVKQFHSNAAINGRPGGADELLAGMANPALHLARRVMFQAVVDGTRTNHFLSNFGLPYKFSADVPSFAFSQAPSMVKNALHKMIWAGGIAAEDIASRDIKSKDEPPLRFNEVLILGYFQDQAIGYHDDGEGWLGPTIVTFSLGSNATMTIRMKPKYYLGTTGNNCMTYDPTQEMIEGCVGPDQRRFMNEHWDNWTDTVQKAEFTKLKKMRHGVLPPVHQISNDGRLRYALTARHVKPKEVDAAQLYKGDYVTTPQDVYYGDMDAFELADKERADEEAAWMAQYPAADQLAEKGSE
ncbi:MAG: hypothetical protein Q9212_000633 [Teloschistes hypoglaucus]